MRKLSRTWMSVVALGALVLAGSALTTSAGAPTASSFVPMAPCRLFDTRTGTDNIGPRAAPIGPGETYTTPAWGTNGDCTIPNGATGLSLNVAIVNPTAPSFLTVFPGQTTKPLAASLNWVAGQAPTPNGVTASLGADGSLSFYNLAGTVDLAVDVVGYYELASAGGTGPQGPKGDPGPRPAQIVWVAKSGGDFTTVSAALASITDASSTKRYVINIAPGTYDEPPLSMKSFVELQGSGSSATLIRCTCPGTDLPANGANGAVINVGASVVTTISGLTAINDATGDQYGVGIRTQSTTVTQVVVRDVVVSVVGATSANYGLYLLGGATVTDSAVTATSGSTATAHGVSASGSTVILRRVSASATTGTTGPAAGVYAVSGSTTLTDSTATATAGGAGDSYGFYASGGQFASATGSTLSASSGSGLGTAYGAFMDVPSSFTRSAVSSAAGGTGGSWGVFTTRTSNVRDSTVAGVKIGIESASPLGGGPAYTVVVSGSTVTAPTNTAKTNASTTMRIGNGTLSGGPTLNGGTLSCAFVMDENGTAPAAFTCPG